MMFFVIVATSRLRSLYAGLRVLTKFSRRDSSISRSSSSRGGRSFARSCLTASMPCSSRKATAFRQEVQLGLR